MTHDRKSSRSVSCFAREDCSVRKARFTGIRKSEISFVLWIIKRNFKLKFSGLTVEKVSIPIIEYTSCIGGYEVLHTGRPFAFAPFLRPAD